MMAKAFKIIREPLSYEEKIERAEIYNSFGGNTGFDEPVDPIVFAQKEIYNEYVEFKCNKCSYEEKIEWEIVQEMCYGMDIPELDCPKCSHTKKKGIFMPKDILITER